MQLKTGMGIAGTKTLTEKKKKEKEKEKEKTTLHGYLDCFYL